MHAGPLPVFGRDTFFLSRVPPGRRRARVAPAIKVQTLAPADPLRGRARDVLFLRAFTTIKRSARVARDAPREIRPATRQKGGKGIAF